MSALLNQSQGYDMCQKIYLMFFWCLKEIVCVKCTENNSYFCHVTTCLHHCHIIVSFWYIRSVISLNEQFCFLQTRQWFSKKKIIPGKLLAAILHFPICPFHPVSPGVEKGAGERREVVYEQLSEGRTKLPTTDKHLWNKVDKKNIKSKHY